MKKASLFVVLSALSVLGVGCSLFVSFEDDKIPAENADATTSVDATGNDGDTAAPDTASTDAIDAPGDTAVAPDTAVPDVTTDAPVDSEVGADTEPADTEAADTDAADTSSDAAEDAPDGD